MNYRLIMAIAITGYISLQTATLHAAVAQAPADSPLATRWEKPVPLTEYSAYYTKHGHVKNTTNFIKAQANRGLKFPVSETRIITQGKTTTILIYNANWYKPNPDEYAFKTNPTWHKNGGLTTDARDLWRATSYEHAIADPTTLKYFGGTALFFGACEGYLHSPTIGQYVSELAQNSYTAIANAHPAIQGVIAGSALMGAFATVWAANKINKTVQRRIDSEYRSILRAVLGGAAKGMCIGIGAQTLAPIVWAHWRPTSK